MDDNLKRTGITEMHCDPIRAENERLQKENAKLRAITGQMKTAIIEREKTEGNTPDDGMYRVTVRVSGEFLEWLDEAND